jgi:hypothetical protein
VAAAMLRIRGRKIDSKVLIDAEELVQLIIDHGAGAGAGVGDANHFATKRVDHDHFEVAIGRAAVSFDRDAGCLALPFERCSRNGRALIGVPK